jgi:hypothetical protein
VIASAVCQVGSTRLIPGREDRRANAEARDTALRRIHHLSPDFTVYWREKIATLCRAFADSYVIAADVSAPIGGQNLIVRYTSYYSPERMHLSRYERVRARCGLSPMSIDVPMTRALHADSYHFETTAPPGCYVFSHHLERLGSREPVKQENIRVGATRQYARLYHDDGRTHAHLYIRHQGARPDIVGDRVRAPTRPDLKSVVRFRETPPGVLGNAAFLALASAAVIGFFGVSRVGIDSPVGSASLPPLVLALPAFVGSALGRVTDHEKLVHAPLIAFFGLYTVIVLSITSALLYIFEASRHLKAAQEAQLSGADAVPRPPPMPGEVSFTVLGGVLRIHTDVFWLAIFFVASVVAAYLVRERRNAFRYYLTITERRAHDGTEPTP